MMAFMLAPSMYRRPPASCTMRAISTMSVSKRPSVLGLVIMMPAVFGPTSSRSESRSMRPSSRLLMVRGFMPMITTDAGLVP